MKLLIALKSASLATKIGLGIGATAIVAAGVTTGVIIVGQINNTDESQIVTEISEKTDEVTASSENQETQDEQEKQKNDTQEKTEESVKEAGEKKPSSDSSSSSSTENKSGKQDSETKTPSKSESSSSSSSSSNQNQSSNSSNESKEEPSAPTKQPDYNLNDKYIAGSGTYYFYIYNKDATDPDEICVQVPGDQQTFFGVTKFKNSASLWEAHRSQYIAYAKSKGYDPAENCVGMGGMYVSWEEAVSMNIALDEAKCAQNGLSCGRW